MKRTDNFDKFSRRKKNSAIKEAFRQEKRKWKKERADAINKRKVGKAQKEQATANGNRPERKGKSEQKSARDSISPSPATSRIKVRKAITAVKQSSAEAGIMPLNKFIAHGGICSRRDAANLVKDGNVRVNGILVTEPGFKVSDQDEILLNGKKVYPSQNLVYILLNKPKDYITTLDDPEGRKTVLDLVKGATTERIYPVGRLDRNTTGLLLLTNDGELAQQLSHPSNQVKKVYEVKLERPLAKKDFDHLMKGVVLEDGPVKPDALAYVDTRDKSVIGIEIHSGRNRIVRRIFEHLGYDVKNLDRVMLANLTKKNLERGKWRILRDKEIRLLKYFNRSVTKKTVSEF